MKNVRITVCFLNIEVSFTNRYIILLCYSKVIWLGDLNYRLRANSDVHEQLRNHDWEALLEKDQVYTNI